MPPAVQIPEEALSKHIGDGQDRLRQDLRAEGGLVEPMLADNRRVGIFDRTGAWWGLRSSTRGPGFRFWCWVATGGAQGRAKTHAAARCNSIPWRWPCTRPEAVDLP